MKQREKIDPQYAVAMQAHREELQALKLKSEVEKRKQAAEGKAWLKAQNKREVPNKAQPRKGGRT